MMADAATERTVPRNPDANLGDADARLGPGRVLLIVGPSGAGKDTLINLVRAQLEDRPDILFPERTVTRAAHAAEAHATRTALEFERELAQGAYALDWLAHGLAYGVPASIDAAVRAGHTIVLNCARAAVARARRRYTNTLVILIDAPMPVRAARLAQRGREPAADIDARLSRSADGFEPGHADVRINNDGAPGIGASRLLLVITAAVPLK